MLSFLSGAVLIGLVYSLSFLPTATLTRSDDIEFVDEDGVMADADGAEASPDAGAAARERASV